METSGDDRPNDTSGGGVADSGCTADVMSAFADEWPSPREQMEGARRAAERYIFEPVQREMQRRTARVRARDKYRSRTDYSQQRERLQTALRVYSDDTFFEEFSREYYAAGTSRLVPRRRRERGWVFGEEKHRSEQRANIIRFASKLDEIDRGFGYDSSEDYDGRGSGPFPGDNHVNRTWQQILQSDLRRLGRIQSRRRLGWHMWIRRLVVRALIPLSLVVLGLLIWNVADEPIWSVAAWVATIWNTPIMWRKSIHRDAFMLGVGDIVFEHHHALVELSGQVRPQVELDWAPRSTFTRDPAAQPLSDLLKRSSFS